MESNSISSGESGDHSFSIPQALMTHDSISLGEPLQRAAAQPGDGGTGKLLRPKARAAGGEGITYLEGATELHLLLLQQGLGFPPALL